MPCAEVPGTATLELCGVYTPPSPVGEGALLATAEGEGVGDADSALAAETGGTAGTLACGAVATGAAGLLLGLGGTAS